MAHLIDIVGHFGTTFSYATVGSRVARALRSAELLGSVENLDPEWHPSMEDLRGDLLDARKGRHLLLFAPPNHYQDVWPKVYGRERSAIFMSPNTDTLADEHVSLCSEFGLAMTPSQWCETVVRRHVPGQETALLPLGVDSAYAKHRARHFDELCEGIARECPSDPRQRPGEHRTCVLHMSTDQSLPGRKGTEELLKAWSILQEGPLSGSSAQLLLHVPPALNVTVSYLVRDLGIYESVDVENGSLRGGGDAELIKLMRRADLVVAPSRCEGFGMIFLAALVLGTPLLCTYATGQADFLSGSSGWLGVPTARVDSMVGEEGNAPVVDPSVLATSLLVAMQPQTRRLLLQSAHYSDSAWGTWEAALPLWVDRLKRWTEGEL